MKKLFFILILLSAASQLFSGKPPKLPKPKKPGEWIEPPKPKNINGVWNWIETDCCGLRHGVSTPSSTGDNIELEIKADNTFYETHTKKNTLPRGGVYTLFKDNSDDMIQFNDERPAKYFLSNDGDTIVFSWKYLELQTEKYIRKK